MDFSKIKFFTPEEFDSPDLPGSGEGMNPDFIAMLDEARAFANVSFFITSGVRTPEHNAKVGGVETSSHLRGRAADIACTTSGARAAIVSALVNAGFNRIGVAPTFIHVDNDPSKAPGVMWLYA